jgi:transaldolase/glucose-6-phosphate isomerase
MSSPSISPATYHLGQYQEAITAEINDLNAKNFTAGFWQKEATLWTDSAEGQESIRSFMGWTRVAETMQQAVPEIEAFVKEVKEAGFEHVVVMGMGGSTMAPIVFEKSFERANGGLPISVLDTTDPGTVQQIEQSVPLDKTLFIVASKSGTTAEPLAFGD